METIKLTNYQFFSLLFISVMGWIAWFAMALQIWTAYFNDWIVQISYNYYNEGWWELPLISIVFIAYIVMSVQLIRRFW